MLKFISKIFVFLPAIALASEPLIIDKQSFKVDKQGDLLVELEIRNESKKSYNRLKFVINMFDDAGNDMASCILERFQAIGPNSSIAERLFCDSNAMADQSTVYRVTVQGVE